MGKRKRLAGLRRRLAHLEARLDSIEAWAATVSDGVEGGGEDDAVPAQVVAAGTIHVDMDPAPSILSGLRPEPVGVMCDVEDDGWRCFDGYL